MSAMVDNIVAFTLPTKRPKIKEQEPLPDGRKVCVLPFRALADPGMTDGAFRALALLCAYSNRAGITWVAQKTLATHMGVSRQAITNQIAKLRALGYVEVVRRGFRGEHTNTLRVIFDANITAEEAITMTSNKEDTRPPAIREEQERQAEEVDRQGLARIAAMITKGLKQPPTKKEATMTKTGDSMTVRKMKEDIKMAKARRTKAVDKSASIGHPPVSYEEAEQDTQDVLHRQPRGHSAVSLISENIGIDKRLTNGRHKDNKVNHACVREGVRDACVGAGMTPEQVRDACALLLPLFAAEGLTPSDRVLIDSILQLHRDAA